ncbi:Peptide methionine sulfoxide reductase [Trema orientale]|uniref:peptide-methionine (S)-S-oxide reductase n=1 Tax=Trema orientale TaxID=63057 RepID=A0A2P5ARH4_TREOI|nr:Peptide methionine sulfoxide reductase [Trema orientale]
MSDFLDSQTTPTTIPEDHHYLSEAIFAGDSFWGLEAAFGRVDGVLKTATGFCGGTLTKPSYAEVSEGRTGHTEAVKVTYDKRRISYKALCDLFWETHDSTNRNYLNFGLIGAHRRSAIFYRNEEERKQAQESKIRKQMKLNKRIVTRIIPLNDSEFFLAENRNQKYYLQERHWLCQSLGLRSTLHFVDSNIACKLNGILAMEGKQIIDKLTTFLQSHELSKQTKSVCEEIIFELARKEDDFENPRAV